MADPKSRIILIPNQSTGRGAGMRKLLSIFRITEPGYSWAPYFCDVVASSIIDSSLR